MTLHIDIHGNGPDLMVLHGWGMNGSVWDCVIPALSKAFRIHVVDLPGYGTNCEHPARTFDEMIAALADAAPPSLAVAGWSLGGQLALAWALRCPAQVARLALIGSTPRFVNGAGWTHGVDASVFEQFSTQLIADYEGTLRRFLSLQARSGSEARRIIQNLRETLFARGKPDASVLQRGLDFLMNNDFRERIGGLAMPVTLIHGTHDTLVPPGAAAWVNEQVADARLHEIPGAAHAPFLSHPELFTEIMTTSLSQCGSPVFATKSEQG